MTHPRPRLARTADIPNPSYYIRALNGEFRDWAFNEERAITYKGVWRQKAFMVSDETPLDLEIGTGNGFHFAHYAQKHPERCVVGLERKFKPLIQAIRRTRRAECENTRAVRYDATFLDHLFSSGEINNVFIHFPDPWAKKKRKKKHRIVQTDFLNQLFHIQRPGSYVEFKTDNRDYFDCAMSDIETSDYEIVDVTFDLHNSKHADQNFVTQFESIFMRQGLPIHWTLLKKPDER